MESKTRLNMDHGFMQAIIRNQVDRDKYDKEVKARCERQPSSKSSGFRPRKPKVSMYVPPTVRSPAEPSPPSREAPPHLQENSLFMFEFEDQNGRVYDFHIRKESDLLEISQDLGQRLYMTAPMILALANFLKLEVKKAESA